MATDGFIVINGQSFPLVQDSLLPAGKRALRRSLRPSQPSDPARMGHARWQLGGVPLGRSREGDDGFLGLDYADNIECLYDDLLTASPAPNNLTLSSDDPPGIATNAFYGGPKYGAAKYGGGTAAVEAGNATHADMQGGYLFVGRGAYDTQINSSFAVVNTVALDGIIAGKAFWQTFGWLGLGSGALLKKRVSVTSSQATYSDVAGYYVGDLKRGNDRLWFVDAQNNVAKYAFDDFTTVGPLNGVIVGDDARALTGIGTMGPYTIFGALDGVFGFTDAGKPVTIDDLDGEDSVNNGLRHASIWGWEYYITDLGLKAWTPNVSNPVGPEALFGFEGPIDGRPTAVWKWRENLFAAYLTTAGDTYIIRGVYGPATEGTGQPLWYPFKKLSSVECHLLYSTPRAFATNPRIVAGRGTNMTSYIMGRRGRDIADSNYQFSTEGGDWYGTTMMRGQHLHNNLRYASFFTEQCSSTKSWQLSVSPDGGAYVNIGSAVTSNGHQIVRPVSGGVPLTTVDFHTLKPKLTQVNDSATTPPQIRGHLEICWDERPDMVEEISVVLHLENPQWWSTLRTLAGHSTETPIALSLPGDTATYYGFVTDAVEEDLKGDGVLGASLSLILWPTS